MKRPALPCEVPLPPPWWLRVAAFEFEFSAAATEPPTIASLSARRGSGGPQLLVGMLPGASSVAP